MVDVRQTPLTGLTVAITADRKGAELQTALHRLGARVVWGPTMRAVPPEVDDLLTTETRALLDADPTWLVISTGSGLRAWLAAAHRVGLGGSVEQLLGRTRTLARGSKSHGALRAVGVDPVFVSATETMDDVCSWLAGQVRADDVVGAQVHGGEVIGSLDGLRSHVAEVLTVAPYRWVLPSDLAAAQRVVEAIADGGVDVLAQTSAPSARNLFAVADVMGLREQVLGALRADVCVASVGPVTARAFDEVGVAVDVMPQRPRTADLLRSIAHWAIVRRGDPGAAPVAP